jgi:hypothetical protein
MKKMFATLAILVLALTLGLPALATAQEGQAAPATQSTAPAAAKSSKKSAKKHAKQASTTNENKPATATSAAAPKQ